MKHERNRQPYDNVLETIGWTPLIKLNHVMRGIRTPVYAKAEFFNPGGSVKDRIGLPIIERAEKEGKLKPGGTIVEGTSGNTGVGLALAAALRGYKCIFTMPDKMSQEKVRLLKAFGAEVIVTPTAVPPDHPDNYIVMAKRIAKEKREQAKRAKAAAAEKKRAQAAAAAPPPPNPELDVRPWLRKLGARPDEANRMAALCDAMPVTATLEERIRFALSSSVRARCPAYL